MPLIAAGFVPTNPNDMHFISSYSIGSIYLGFSSDGLKLSSSLFIKVGRDGPYISESKMPTLNPLFFKVAAILTATVLFPTPPLQLLTAMIFLICWRFFFFVNFYY